MPAGFHQPVNSQVRRHEDGQGDKLMEFTISPLREEDRNPVIDIFNYYIANSFAAYPEEEVPYEAFDVFMQMCRGYPTGTVKDSNGKVLGFGFLRVHNPMPVFSETWEVTYFSH